MNLHLYILNIVVAVVFTLGTGFANNLHAEQISFVTKDVNVHFNAVGNLIIVKNTYLKFEGNSFKAKTIKGKGTLVLKGIKLQLGIEKISNLELRAAKTHLCKRLIVSGLLVIDPYSTLFLNDYNLFVSSENTIFRLVIVENGFGRVLHTNFPNSHFHCESIPIAQNTNNTLTKVCLISNKHRLNTTYCDILISKVKTLIIDISKPKPPSPPPR